MNRAARNRFPGPVERPRPRGPTRARLSIVARHHDEKVRACFDKLTDGESPAAAHALLRRAVAHAADRLGLTIETSTFLASKGDRREPRGDQEGRGRR